MSCATIGVAGGQIAVAALFRNQASGEPADPDTLTFTVTDPNGMETTYTFGVDAELTKVSDGSFVLSLATMANQAGEWEFLVSGTGAAGGSKRERFLVAA